MTKEMHVLKFSGDKMNKWRL